MPMAAIHHLWEYSGLSSSYTDLFWAGHDGLRLYCRVYEGPSAAAATVLCLHGLTRNSRDFEDLAPHLQARYRVIVPDVRGRGRSARDPNPQNYQPAIYIQDIIGALDAVGADRVTVIGWDGSVGDEAATLFAERLYQGLAGGADLAAPLTRRLVGGGIGVGIRRSIGAGRPAGHPGQPSASSSALASGASSPASS